MDITGTNSLWKDYDVSALPLNPSALSVKTENGITLREFYYDGFTTVDGRVRAYIRILENPIASGVVLYLPDGDDMEPAETFYNNGFTVAILDYAGKRLDRKRFTMYPEQLSACNINDKTSFDAPDDALYSCWFIWTCMARRAILLLKELYPTNKIFAFGKKLGGTTVYKLCAFDDGLTAAATALSVLPEVNGSGNQMINYKAALDNYAYAAITKIPLFMAVASNDEDGSLDDMSELAQTTASLQCIRILERAFSGNIHVTYEQILGFFGAYTTSAPICLRPTIKAINSENKLYFNINIKDLRDDERLHEKVELFAAFCVKDPKHRNWTNISLLRLAGNEYMAHADVLQNEKPVYAFVNMTDTEGNTVSSTVTSIIPKSLGIPSSAAVNRRMLYDGSLGKDVWASPGGGNLKVAAGPFDIEGITSDSHMLVTFKPGDLLYTADKDALLQVIVSGSAKQLTVEVSDGNDTYTSTVSLPNSSDWHKFTLAYTDFKSTNGQILDWSKIIMIKLHSDADFIISSMLWV